MSKDDKTTCYIIITGCFFVIFTIIVCSKHCWKLCLKGLCLFLLNKCLDYRRLSRKSSEIYENTNSYHSNNSQYSSESSPNSSLDSIYPPSNNTLPASPRQISVDQYHLEQNKTRKPKNNTNYCMKNKIQKEEPSSEYITAITSSFDKISEIDTYVSNEICFSKVYNYLLDNVGEKLK